MTVIKDLTLKKTITVNAPASGVWKALTDPAMIREYFFGTDVHSSWKEGEAIVFRGQWEGKEYEDKGTILKLVPEKLLTYNYWSNLSGTEDAPENYSNITYRLEERDGKTSLTILQEGFKSQEALEHSEQSWGYVMEGMKKLIEK